MFTDFNLIDPQFIIQEEERHELEVKIIAVKRLEFSVLSVDLECSDLSATELVNHFLGVLAG